MIQVAIETLKELKRMHQLNLELLEQLNVTCQWIIDNNIQVSDEEHMSSLLNKSLTLLNEIYSKPYDDSYHDAQNRRKVNRT
jgi:hypothetical protein